MKRIGSACLVWCVAFAWWSAGPAQATPAANGAIVTTRTFNDCPSSVVTTSNAFPASIQITDAMDPDCIGFANLHSWSFSADGGSTAAVFNNNSNYHFGADFKLDGAGEGEGGLRISPWYGQFVDGRVMVNATTGEIACFGGALPFYSFTVNHGINYVKGTTIHLEATYVAHDLFTTGPATIQYRVVYNGNTYDSPVLPFGEQNPNECVHGLFGMLDDGRVGGYFQPRANTGASLTASWTSITYAVLPAVGTPVANGAIVTTRTFNDCPSSAVTTSNNYPASIQITDAMDPDCIGFANLHSWSFSEDGGATAAVFNNNSEFHFGADFKLDGAGQGEGGLRISPWYGQFVDGRIMASATTGEIACFGGALPFYSFTVNHGITYVKGTTIHLEATYAAHDLVATDPATIQYRVVYNGNTYDSPVLPFGEQNENECAPHGLWGMLNDGRVGGYFQPRANTGASLTATWGNVTYGICPVTVEFTLKPGTLNPASKGRWINAFIEPPPPLLASDIDVSSIRVNGTVAVAPGAPTSIGDFDSDGIPDLEVKLNRAALVSALGTTGEVEVTVHGLIGAECFEGSTRIRVLASPPVSAPAAGSVLQPGTVQEIRWQPDGDRLVDLVATFDDGATWSVVARNVRNTGSCSWTVPQVSSAAARVGVVRIAFIDPSGIVEDAEIQESGTFSIGVAAGVSGELAFGLRGVSPVPARVAFSVAFALPSAERATLALYDVAGRQVVLREVGSHGPGIQRLTVGAAEGLRPGLYVVRLTQGGRSQAARALLVP